MSGVISGIGTAFRAVGSAAARVGKAVMGVGATAFTAGAAAKAGPMAAGGLSGIVQSFTGPGVLGNVLTGAIKQAGYGALIGGAIGAVTGQGFGRGALMGGLGGAITGGLSGASSSGLFGAAGQTPPSSGSGLTAAPTATGAAPTGITGGGGANALVGSSGPVSQPYSGLGGMNTPREMGFGPGSTVSSAAPAAAGGGFGQFMSKAGDFLKSETGGALLGGLGKGLGSYMDSKAKSAEAEKDRQFLREKDQRITDSYKVDPSVYQPAIGPSAGAAQRPAPASKYGRIRYQFDPSAGRVVPVPA